MKKNHKRILGTFRLKLINSNEQVIFDDFRTTNTKYLYYKIYIYISKQQYHA